MKPRILSSLIIASVLGAVSVQAQLTYSLSPLTSFSGDGWLAPGEGGISYLGTGGTERGLAYNPSTGNLLLVSRTSASAFSVNVLDGATGASEGALNLGAGVISGGTFTGNMVAATADGAIYVANLASPVSGANAFKVYRWADEGATPTLAYSSTSITTGRLGDSFDAIGTGANTLLLAGESNNAGTGARNGYAVLSTTDGLSYSGTKVAFAGTPPAAGDHRLGITFIDQNTVMGTQGGTLRLSDFTGAAGTLVDSSATTTANERPMDFAVVGGVPVLATVDTASSVVRIYNLSNPNDPTLVASGTATSGELTAGNGTGQVRIGAVNGNTATVYALAANQGIQAFTFTVVPEPETYAAMAAAGLLAFGLWRKLGR